MIAREVGKTIREAREEMEEFTVDHFRRASEDVLRYAGSVPPLDAGVGGHEADHGGAGADRRGRGHLAVELPGRHRGHPARVRPRARLHDGLEAVRVRALCANMFVQLLHDAGFPPGTVNLVHGRGDVGAQLVTTRTSARSCSPARSRRASAWRATPG